MDEIIKSIDLTWMLLGTVLVFFMQAGFACVETGFTRQKNAGNIIMKNLMDFVIGTLVFWFLGFGLMFGKNNPIIGSFLFFTTNEGDYATLMFQTVFCATSATIVSGAMAERTKFISYLIYSCVISLLIYPISGHWIWGGGFLSSLGFHDFAGSTAVHMVGGLCALIGAKILGPRIGKYDKDGKPKAILGHNLPIAALGVFILWFCWFGFNGGSTMSMSNGNGELAAKVFYTTNLAAASATIVTMLVTWIKYKKPDVSMTLNGSLAGLVAITAGCDIVEPWAAAIIGAIAGFVVVFYVEFIDKKLRIDDPVGAIAVHFGCGALGTILTGLFANEKGLFLGGGFEFLGVQVLGVLCVCLWVSVMITITFFIIKKTIGLRVTPEEEIQGLDISEHGLISAYADFVPQIETQQTYFDSIDYKEVPPIEKAIPVVLKSTEEDTNQLISKLEIICPQNRFDLLKKAFDEQKVNGMTVTNVLGCGAQKGHLEYYRGVKTESILLPKIKVEVVVAKKELVSIIKNVREALYTGHIGDGKVFIVPVTNVIKVRTGEESLQALANE